MSKQLQDESSAGMYIHGALSSSPSHANDDTAVVVATGDTDGVIPMASAVLIDPEVVDVEANESETFQDEHCPPSSTRAAITAAPPPEPSPTFLMIPGDLMGLPAGQTVLYQTVLHQHEDEGSSGNNTTLLRHLGRFPQTIDCPLCHETMVETLTTQQIGGFAIFVSLFTVLVAWPFFWLPLVLPICKVTRHYCPKCHQQVGETEACG